MMKFKPPGLAEQWEAVGKLNGLEEKLRRAFDPPI